MVSPLIKDLKMSLNQQMKVAIKELMMLHVITLSYLIRVSMILVKLKATLKNEKEIELEKKTMI